MYLNKNNIELKYLRENIPSFECKKGCHDCCGPVTTSSEEISRLPEKSEEEHTKALTQYNCPYLGPNGCEVYEERPLICRLFGTTASLPCPNGCRPEQWVDVEVEKRVHKFISSTRQLLV